MQKIIPCLWLDDRIEEAVNFYLSVFRDGKVLKVSRYGEGASKPAGRVLTITFQIQGQELMALNGGAEFKFNEAVSFLVRCSTQGEVDYYWSRLLEGGGQESHCAWLKDRYGMFWQIVPTVLGEYLNDKDPQKSQRVLQAMVQMKKIDIATLERARAG